MKFFKILLLFFAIPAFVYPEPQNYQKINKLKETIEGEKLYSQGKYDEAIQVFKQAIEKGETRGEPQFYLGSIYENRHKYEESIPYYEQAVGRELSYEFREATLWKLIILHRKEQNYSEMLSFIDMLEDMGVKHTNLDKFREEAEISLSPEKIEARIMIKESKKIIEDWNKEHSGDDFWGENGAGEQRDAVLENYEKAIALDESLFSLYWDIADHYEKMSFLKKAANIYDLIIEKNKDGEAYYKNGVLSRRTGNYEVARDYFKGALENLKKEEIRYYILVNLTQVLYALGDYENGIRYSHDARAIDRKRQPNSIAIENVMYCLHLSLKNDVSELKKQCQSIIDRKDLLKNDVRIISLYYFMIAESERAIEETAEKPDEKRRKSILQNYSKALFPPIIRSAPLNSLKLKERPDLYDDTDWVSIPAWSLVRINAILPFFQKVAAYREMYLTLGLYKNYLIENHDLYYNYLGEVAYSLGKNPDCIKALREISERNQEQEYLLFRAYLVEKEWENFQNEFLSYLKANPANEADLKNFLLTEPYVKVIPETALRTEIKNYLIIAPESSVNSQ